MRSLIAPGKKNATDPMFGNLLQATVTMEVHRCKELTFISLIPQFPV